MGDDEKGIRCVYEKGDEFIGIRWVMWEILRNKYMEDDGEC